MYFKYNLPLCLFFCWLLSVSLNQATAQVVLTSELDSSISIHESVWIFDAGNRSYSLQEVIRERSSLPFEKGIDENANLGFTENYFWVEFSIENQTSKRVQYFFETARPLIDTVILYTIHSDGSIQTQLNGDAIPFHERTVKHRNILFNLDLEAGEKQQYYLQIKSDGESLMMPLMLRSKDAVLIQTYTSQVFYGFFYGILVLASIIYLFFYFALRDRTFLYYSLYVIFIGLLQFALDGFFFQFVIPEGGWLFNRSVLIIAILAAIFLGTYGEAFLKVADHLPRIHLVFRGIYIALIGMLGALLTIPAALPIGYPVANGLGLLVLVMILVSIVTLRVRKVRIDPFFISGIACLVMGFVVFILNNFNAISNSFLSNNGPKIGTGLEVVFLSISMSNLIRVLREEKEANQQLALQRSRDMNDIKSSFISNISHELRTPLNLIMGVTSSLYKSSQSGDEKDQLEMVMNSSESLLHSIDDILNFTVIEKGDQILKNKPVGLKNILNEISTAAQIKATAKGLSYRDHLSADVPESIIGDEDKLRQILNVLIDNAIKFTESGGLEMNTSVVHSTENRCRLHFEILDTGVGIPKEKMSTIFESFTKKSFEDKREFGGLGLGLYIAKTFVNLMDGTISLSNRQTGGVKCEVVLEYEVIPPKSVEVRKRMEEVEPNSSAIPNISILYVEDNEMNQMVLNLLVKQWGNATLETANNGLEGVEKLRDGNFDIVLMDLQMPVMDGFEAIAAIRNGDSGEINKEIPIVAVTADITEATKEKVFNLGVSDYLTKPVNGDSLYGTIQRQLMDRVLV